MRVEYASTTGRIKVSFDADGQKALFAALADLADVLETECCGLCESGEIVHEHRVVESFDYYSFRCRGCGAQLSLGQYKDGRGLFIKRQDKDGNPLGKNGWHKWQGKGEQQGDSRCQPQQSGNHGAQPSRDDYDAANAELSNSRGGKSPF